MKFIEALRFKLTITSRKLSLEDTTCRINYKINLTHNKVNKLITLQDKSKYFDIILQYLPIYLYQQLSCVSMMLGIFSPSQVELMGVVQKQLVLT